MKITTNTAAFNVWRHYSNNMTSLKKSMSRLSSGSRINNSGDDPSGLAMSERLRAQARNTAAAATNVENRLNYLQTADSWMQKIQDMLGRMGELAVMANDGTKSTTDVAVLQSEFAQMQGEIARITSGEDAAGTFNGINLFQDTAGISLQVGADGGQEFTGMMLNLTTEDPVDPADTSKQINADGDEWGDLINAAINSTSGGVALVDVDLGTVGGTITGDPANAVKQVNYGLDFISQKRASVGAEMKRMEHTLSGLRSYEENISATESRIRDVDVAKETAEMSKFQILQQVGTAMLAQANQTPNNVMQLFG